MEILRFLRFQSEMQNTGEAHQPDNTGMRILGVFQANKF